MTCRRSLGRSDRRCSRCCGASPPSPTRTSPPTTFQSRRRKSCRRSRSGWIAASVARPAASTRRTGTFVPVVQPVGAEGAVAEVAGTIPRGVAAETIPVLTDPREEAATNGTTTTTTGTGRHHVGARWNVEPMTDSAGTAAVDNAAGTAASTIAIERGFDRFERGRSSRDGFYDRGDDGWDTRPSRGGRGGRGFDSQRGRGRGRGDRPGMGDRDADFGRRARTKGGFGSDLDGLDRGEDDGAEATGWGPGWGP